MNTENVLDSPKTQGRKRAFTLAIEEEIAARYWGWCRSEESAESLALEYGRRTPRGSISVNAIRNIACRVRDQKKEAPTPCTSSGRDPHEADQTSHCHSDDTASLTKTEEGI